MSLEGFAAIFDSRGVSLASAGVCNRAFRKDDALAALRELEGTGIRVIGAEASLLERSGTFNYHVSWWTCDPREHETAEERMERYLEAARQFVEEYPDFDQVYYSFTLDSEEWSMHLSQSIPDAIG